MQHGKNEITVSICCLTYNHVAFIRKALDGFLAQQANFSFEIFIHDDCSTDGTDAIIEDFRCLYPDKVRLLVQPSNLVSRGWSLYDIYTKIAFPQLKGKYIAICEGDDYWTDPRKLQRQIDFLEANREYSVCFHDVGYTGDDTTDFYEHKKYYHELFDVSTEFELTDIIRQNFIPNCSVVYRNIVKNFPERFNTCEFPDWPIHVVFAAHGKMHYIPEMMAIHRKHASGAWEGQTIEKRTKSVFHFYKQLLGYLDSNYHPAILEAIDRYIPPGPDMKFSDAFNLGVAVRQEKAEQAIRERQDILDRVFSSNTWRLANRMRIISENVFPKGSVQRRLASAAFGSIQKARGRNGRDAGKGSLRKIKKVKNPVWPSGEPLVSVVIPHFNYGKFVVEAVDSVLGQTFTSFEVIVVDGGSTDKNSLEVIRKIDHPGVTVHFREGRHLAGDNRNYGINLARGKYICCLDADDKIDPTYLEKAVFYLEALHYDVVYPWVQSFGDDTTLWKTEPATFEILTETANVVATNAVFIKSAWQETGGYNDYPIGKGHVSEDWEFWTRVAAMGYRFQSIPEPLLFYRKHGNSLADASQTTFDEQRAVISEENDRFRSDEFRRRREQILNCDYRVKNPFVNLKQKKERKTILVALPFMIVGGVDTLFLNVFGHLSKSYDIIFFTTLEFGDELGDNTERFRNISPHIYHLQRFLDCDEKRMLFIRYLVTCRQPDVMLIAGSELAYHCLPEIKKEHPSLKVIDTLFNESGHMENNRAYARFIDLNIVENERIRQVLQHTHGERPEKISLIPNGINLDLNDEKTEKTAARAKLGLAEDKFLVVFLGRFSIEKNPYAVPEIARKLPAADFQFLMAGKGPLYEEVVRTIRQQKMEQMVLTPGFLDMREVLSAADVLILPSTLDGRPNAVLEALAMGVPVVASNIGGLPSLIHDSENGFLVRPDEPVEFVEKLLMLKNNPELLKKMEIAARKFAGEFLDDKIMHRAYEETIFKLLNH